MQPSGVTETADLEARVAAAAACCLRLPPGVVGPDVPFARLGLDSLGCLELAGDLETALGIRVPAEALVECTTVRSLCATLTRGARADPCDRMRADAELAADIRPGPSSGVSLAGARHVLLTGATGFLGSALLERLLARTDARVTCLVRSVPRPDLHDDRVEFVRGDLTRPFAGLTSDAWHRLVTRADAVCHAGASINWVAGYDALRDVNVLGTHELLRLASQAGASFHFISSASVCYSSAGPRAVDERHDPLQTIDGLHFGYAQSKAVAESLVRQAGARGLGARIYRPAFISGHSRTGQFNRDDMLSRLIAGCARIGAAPDLDWQLDALPVNTVAALVLALSGEPGEETWHLTHPRPRHWRECMLWMRLYGYDVTLIPYREWTARLREAVADPNHPLRPLRSFFLDERVDRLTIPELHERSRAPRLLADRTHAAIERAAVGITPLDAALMDRYFAAFVAEGTLPAPRRRRSMPRLAGGNSPGPGAEPFAAGHSIISELTAWQSGGPCGLYRTHGAGGRPLVLKCIAHAEDVQAVGEALADLCGGRLGDAYRRFGGGLGSASGHEREVALYRDTDSVLRAHTPAVLATTADPGVRAWSVLLEDMRGAEVLDAVDMPEAWTQTHVCAAVDGIAAVHGAWHARAGELRRQPWIGSMRNTASVRAMTPLWRALADHAAPMFAQWTDASLPRLQHALIDRIGDWRAILDAAPQTLIHNDFNPRNVCLRSAEGEWRLCAFDWELATVGTPVRDLAEFLCFVAPPDVQKPWVTGLIERHAAGFASTACVPVDPAAWHAALGAALAELLVDRLSIYAMVHRVKRQPFLPRVLRTWAALYSLFPVHGLAG